MEEGLKCDQRMVRERRHEDIEELEDNKWRRQMYLALNDTSTLVTIPSIICG